MKKGIAFILMFALLGTFAFAQGSNESASGGSKNIVLKYSEITAGGNPMADTAQLFADEVAKLSDGRIIIDIYTSGQLGDGPASYQALQMGGGAIDIYRGNTVELSDFGVDKAGVFGLPFVFRDRSHLWSVLESEIGNEILADVQESGSGMVGLFYLDEGARHVFTKEPVKSIDDLQGLKIRVPETELMMNTMKTIGVSPTPMAYSELYTSLQTGTVDGAENPLTGYLSNKFYEVAPYLLLTSHTYSPSMVLMSEDTWNKLSPEDQQIIVDAGKIVEQANKENAARIDTESLDELKSLGVEVTQIADMTPFLDAIQSVIANFVGDNADLYDRIISTN